MYVHTYIDAIHYSEVPMSHRPATCSYLSEGDVVELATVVGEAHLLTQSLHVLQWVHTRAEDEEHWGGRACLLEGDLKWNGPLLHVLGTQLLLYKQSGKG